MTCIVHDGEKVLGWQVIRAVFPAQCEAKKIVVSAV